jgi:hypothetical protein
LRRGFYSRLAPLFRRPTKGSGGDEQTGSEDQCDARLRNQGRRDPSHAKDEIVEVFVGASGEVFEATPHRAVLFKHDDLVLFAGNRLKAGLAPRTVEAALSILRRVCSLQRRWRRKQT